jgi:uncharacterized membrane protein YfcA
MQLDPNPYFRKAITPWYDSSFSCKALILMMIFVFVFAAAGVLVGLQTPSFRDHVWFPGFLAFLSLFLVIKLFFRLRQRSKNN